MQVRVTGWSDLWEAWLWTPRWTSVSARRLRRWPCSINQFKKKLKNHFLVSSLNLKRLWHHQQQLHKDFLDFLKCQVILSWNPSFRTELDFRCPGGMSKAGNVPRNLNNSAVVTSDPSRKRKFEPDFDIKKIWWSPFSGAQWLKKIRIK